MAPHQSRLRRSLERGGPLGVALVLGVVLVASSGLSYRDARLAAGMVAERQGVGLLHRVAAELAPYSLGARGAAALQAALDSNRSLGLLYLGVLEGDHVGAEVGHPVLGDTWPRVGAPVFGHGRVRMISPGPRPQPFTEGDDRAPFRPPGPPPPCGDPDHPCPPFAEPGPDRAYDAMDHPPPGPPPGGPRPRRPLPLVIEFEPIGSADAVGRALVVLWLSSSAAILLAAAALILSTKARRADRAEAQLSAQLAAQRHLARLGEMSAVLAHEIRNPLAALKGHAQLLGERVVEPELAARVERVVKEAVRLEQLTNDLLEFARSGAIQLGPTSPAELMERVARATDVTRVERASIGARDIVEVDAARIEQVLINLVENALQVTPPDRKVQIAAGTENDGLVFTVRDHGPGVAAADRARIFEPFHTTKTRGTGLGLAVASRIVELHGGRIDVLDGIGGGAIFRVFLPSAPHAPSAQAGHS